MVESSDKRQEAFKFLASLDTPQGHSDSIFSRLESVRFADLVRNIFDPQDRRLVSRRVISTAAKYIRIHQTPAHSTVGLSLVTAAAPRLGEPDWVANLLLELPLSRHLRAPLSSSDNENLRLILSWFPPYTSRRLVPSLLNYLQSRWDEIDVDNAQRTKDFRIRSPKSYRSDFPPLGSPKYKSSTAKQRRRAIDPLTPIVELEQLAKNSSIPVRCAVISNPSSTLEIIRVASRRLKKTRYFDALIRNPSPPFELLEEMMGEFWGHWRLSRGSAVNARTVAAMLHPAIRAQSFTEFLSLRLLYWSPQLEKKVRAELSQLPETIFLQALSEEDPHIRQLFADISPAGVRLPIVPESYFSNIVAGLERSGDELGLPFEVRHWGELDQFVENKKFRIDPVLARLEGKTLFVAGVTLRISIVKDRVELIGTGEAMQNCFRYNFGEYVEKCERGQFVVFRLDGPAGQPVMNVGINVLLNTFRGKPTDPLQLGFNRFEIDQVTEKFSPQSPHYQAVSSQLWDLLRQAAIDHWDMGTRGYKWETLSQQSDLVIERRFRS